jgi:hypothetical protein
VVEQVIASGSLDSPPLSELHGFHGILGLATRARLDFHKDKEIAIRADQVDLAEWAAVVARENTMTALSEVLGSLAFTAIAQQEFPITRTR